MFYLVKTMRKFYFYLIGMLLTFAACSEETEITLPSKGEEEVKEIVSALEENDEISDFVEVLKTVNVADLEEDELTVFAVRNSSAAMSRSAALDSTSVKRHTAKGRYGKVDLTDGKVLESISGESLYVTRAGEDIYINGVVIEGEAIQAGNSYVYVVPEVMEQQSEPVNVYVTTINVYAINQGNSAKSPLKDVTVVVNKAKKDSLGIIYTKGDSLGVWKTDEQGQVVVKHTEKLIAFNVYKADYSDKYDNYLLGGIDNTGKFMYVDLNGDGKFAKEDKVDFALPYYVDYENNTKASTKTVYMTRTGEDIYINGVVIEGEAIQAGNSYVYVVPEVMEQQSEPVNVYVTTINVYAINQGNSSESPLKDVAVVVNKVGKDSLGIYTKGDSLGVWKTDEQGQVVIKHTENQIVFNVYKADYSDKYDNYLLA